MLDASSAKIGSLNKTKDKLTNEIRELTIEIDNLGGECSCKTQPCELLVAGFLSWHQFQPTMPIWDAV